jgi:hypothetical protein
MDSRAADLSWRPKATMIAAAAMIAAPIVTIGMSFT